MIDFMKKRKLFDIESNKFKEFLQYYVINMSVEETNADKHTT